MGKIVHREIVQGRMTVTQVRQQKGKEYTVDVETESLFGRKPLVRQVTRREKGYLYVEVLVYPFAKEEGTAVGEWEMPIQLRYDLGEAARIAALQQIDQEKREKARVKSGGRTR